MYGVPANLPLERFVGQELSNIGLTRAQTYLTFDVGNIAIGGRWELHDVEGTLVDAWQEHADRDCYRLHRLIDLPVVRFEIDAPRSFTLVFDPGFRLTVFDDSEQYESFSVDVNGMPSIYV